MVLPRDWFSRSTGSLGLWAVRRACPWPRVLEDSSCLDSAPLTRWGVKPWPFWDQELSNLVSRNSNFPSSPQILQITDSTARLQIQPAHYKWSPVWVNNNYEWSCWFDLLWKFIWTIKWLLRTPVIVHFQWIQQPSLPLLEKLKNEQCFVVSAALNRPSIPSSWFVMIVWSYLFKGWLHLIVVTCCLGFECSSRRSASALERLPLVTAFLIRLLLRRRTEEEEN